MHLVIAEDLGGLAGGIERLVRVMRHQACFS